VSLTAGVHRLVAVRPWQARSAGARSGPPRLVDAVVATAALAGSLALVTHGGGLTGVVHSRTSSLDAARVVLVTLATVPLVAWRRSPLGVFALTASASILLAADGIVIWPPLGPATALYLLASSRDEAAPWTPRSAGVVMVLLIAYLGAGMAALGFAGSDLIHAGLAYVAAWFAGERTRLRREQMTELRQRAVLAEQQAVRSPTSTSSSARCGPRTPGLVSSTPRPASPRSAPCSPSTSRQDCGSPSPARARPAGSAPPPTRPPTASCKRR